MLADHKIKGLTVDQNKVLASICYVIDLAEKINYRLTQYDIAKSLFLADRQHLNEYGRPITFDNYVAMRHGPVPSCGYDLLKSNECTLRRLNIESLPWESIPIGKGQFWYKNAASEAYKCYLSESDREALQSAFNSVRSLSFGQIRRLTHEDPAYIDAWEENGGRAAYDMNLALLFEKPNVELAEDLVELSQYVQSG